MGRTRLDVWLTKKYPSHSRSYFHRLIESGCVRVNGKKERKSSFVHTEDRVEVEFLPDSPALSFLVPEPIPLQVVYEDDFLLVVDKPAGMVVHPGPGHHKGTFAHAFLHRCCVEQDEASPSLRPGIVHRLDRETSGLLLAAKTIQAQKDLSEQFARREVKKEYLLLARGRLRATPLEIDVPVGRDPRDRKKMRASSVLRGRYAHTKFLEHDFENQVSLLSAFPLTGRQHQIRVHLKLMGMSLIGDKLYGTPEKNVQRHMLHAFRLEFLHPVYRTKIALETSFPVDFALCCSRYGFDLKGLFDLSTSQNKK
ncbi:RluA family pseudouridine synthase [Candidatus Similichlamydia laticola]|uniref:Pseudouridine synthase n=1 Tax=Candidatus Similichlamydia laticola TaxID=2170265 RepID=A0A369KF49_9BACT|nr:RluA family pseudouridine synthase [Candidatus Similichlamydia laticola]RDB31325.1 Ribosomal large subunit pseudouridine synthase D [Candidatus Similichlamydia laticola]